LPAESPVPRRPSRYRLYLPLGLLLLLVAAWSAGWFFMRGRLLSGMDGWLAAEASAGRQWTCDDRAAGGYPFRIELSCARLRLERADATASLGRVLAVAQVYRLGHIIIEAQGPLRVTGQGTDVQAEWRLLQASVIFASSTFQRLALVAQDAKTRIATPTQPQLDLAARTVEVHARPDPSVPTTADIAFSADGALVPGLDALVGGTEPANLDLVLRVSRATDLPARPIWAELERWRAAGGGIEIARANLVKGPRRVEAQGNLALDDAHRPAGELRGQVAGIEGVLGQFVGDRAGLAGNLLGALLGGKVAAPEARPPSDPKAPRMKPIPPLRLENGRLAIGPLQLPNVRVPALY
jgi:hypothetical protein